MWRGVAWLRFNGNTQSSVFATGASGVRMVSADVVYPAHVFEILDGEVYYTRRKKITNHDQRPTGTHLLAPTSAHVGKSLGTDKVVSV